MSRPLRILQFGRTGQLARAMARAAPRANIRLTALGRGQADLSTPGEAARAIAAATAAARPDIVLIAAAWTAVDAAEGAGRAARRINAGAPAEIADACAARDVPLIHISTDYVFSGAPGPAWREADAPAPLNAYGRTKLAGERAVLAASARNLAIRTSWVFSPWGRNFVTTMLRLAETRDEVAVVADQHGRPTGAQDLAAATVALAHRLAGGAPGGLLHFANAGATDWASFAEEVFAQARPRGLPAARVRRIATRDYPTPAARPANSVLDTAMIQALGITPRPWRAALGAALDDLATR